jgi:adenylate kinase family enzyme
MTGSSAAPMNRVAVFGNGGGGKSTLARRLAELTRLPLHQLDQLQYRRGGDKLPHDEFLRLHADLLGRAQWIIEGYGCVPSSDQRFALADTLIFVDLPLLRHYGWVTKRMIKGLWVNPEGWPENSPIWRSSLDSYRVVGRYNRHLTPRYRQLVAEAAATKRVHHLRSPAEIRQLLEQVAKAAESG